MEGMGLKFATVIERHLLDHLTCLGLWLVFLGLIASPNSPNGGFNPPFPSTHPTPSHLPNPYNMPSVIL